ncbi:MAG TPA: calcium/proton exchanger [Ktedonobacteraceae bacterium]|nr:calcium/proton exchanger [Ktedonobacteraceae bacterium]
MSRWLYVLLLAAPGAFIAEALHASPLVVFIIAALGLIPLAGLIGTATESLAEHLGHGIGGLLNATFGNAAEIIIGLAALSAGLPEVVRASLAGSIIGNVLLVLGSAMLVGGWKHIKQRFDRRTAGQYATMIALAVIGMAIPSLLATVGESTQPGSVVVRGSQLHQLSIWISLVLLICYAAYIASSVFGLRTDTGGKRGRAAGHSEKADEQAHSEAHATEKKRAHHHFSTAHANGGAGEDGQRKDTGFIAQFARLWVTTIWLPIVVLAAATAVTAVVSEVLVGTIEPLTEQVGLNPFFVGLIILPIVGNAAEHFSAITSASRNHMEISMAITAGSSIQIALLAAPVLVLAGAIMGAPLDLNFSLLEVAMFGLVAGLYALISLDGESTWLEGLQLLVFYLIVAVGAFFIPG